MSKVVVETAGWIRGESDVVTVEVAMVYETSDPYAVRLHITADEERRCWTFGRDLLADGLRSMVPVGEGAIQVQATSVLTEISVRRRRRRRSPRCGCRGGTPGSSSG